MTSMLMEWGTFHVCEDRRAYASVVDVEFVDSHGTDPRMWDGVVEEDTDLSWVRQTRSVPEVIFASHPHNRRSHDISKGGPFACGGDPRHLRRSGFLLY